MYSISSTPVENSVQFLRLRDQYKSKLLDDSRLTKAADLAAQQHLLLESNSPDGWKEPRLKFVGRQLRQWTEKIRQPGNTRTIGSEDLEEEYDDGNNLAVGPMQQCLANVAKIQKGIKRPETPDIKQTPITPDIKPKFSFKTGSKGNCLLPKTPRKRPVLKS